MRVYSNVAARTIVRWRGGAVAFLFCLFMVDMYDTYHNDLKKEGKLTMEGRGEPSELV